MFTRLCEGAFLGAELEPGQWHSTPVASSGERDVPADDSGDEPTDEPSPDSDDETRPQRGTGFGLESLVFSH